MLYTHSVDPHRPWRLCTARPSILLYANHASHPYVDVRWLFCGGPTPKPTLGTNVTRTEQAGVHDMSCVQSTPLKPLLIVACGYQGAFAYDTTTGTVEWNVKGKLPGMTKILSAQQIVTDGSGHLFMCDGYNDCIQMFNLEGQYMGVATREGDPYIGKPRMIQWCKSTSSLVVAHVNFTKHNISKIQIQGELAESQLADDMLNESNEATLEPGGASASCICYR